MSSNMLIWNEPLSVKRSGSWSLECRGRTFENAQPARKITTMEQANILTKRYFSRLGAAHAGGCMIYSIFRLTRVRPPGVRLHWRWINLMQRHIHPQGVKFWWCLERWSQHWTCGMDGQSIAARVALKEIAVGYDISCPSKFGKTLVLRRRCT